MHPVLLADYASEQAQRDAYKAGNKKVTVLISMTLGPNF